MKKVDYSSSAISRRIRQTEQLRKLSLSLMKAKPISEERAAELRYQIRKEKQALLHPQIEDPKQPELPENTEVFNSRKTKLE